MVQLFFLFLLQEALKTVHTDARDWALLALETISDLADGQHWIAALTLASGVLEDTRLTQQTAGVAQLYEAVMIPAVQSEEPRVRAAAVRVLGVYSTAALATAVTQTLLFVTVLNQDAPIVAHEAQRVLLDLCLLFGAAYAERLDEAAINELRNGPQLEGESHAVLARLLAPLAHGPNDTVTPAMMDTLWTGKR